MQIRAIEVAMSVTNFLLKKSLFFIDAMSVLLRLKFSEIYEKVFFTLMVNLEVFVIIVIWVFIRPKIYQLIY